MSISPGPGADRSPADPPYPLTRPVSAMDHVRQLRRDGGSYRAIATAAGLGHATVHDTATGRHHPTPFTAAALLNVTPSAVTRARVDAGGTRLRLRALYVMGHSAQRIARAAGVREMTIRTLVAGDARTTSPRLRDTITAIYDTWWDKRPPERTPGQRAAASAARRRAITGNWCPGAALDDDRLDVPGYKPQAGWKPARGTGTAPDLHPPSRQQGRTRHGHR